MAAVVAPASLGEVPHLLPRIETFISAACGGPTPCPSPERRRWLAALDKVLAKRMPSLPADDRTRLARVIYDEAKSASLDPVLILAVIAVESGFDRVAQSERGARGLMQLRPATLRREAERSQLDGDLDDPVLNVRAGVRYYTRLIRAFGSTDLALMAYNAGPNRILKYLEEKEGIPERFRVYPRRVKTELARLRLHLPRLRLGPPGGAAESVGLGLGWQAPGANAPQLELGWQAAPEVGPSRPES
jgi:hypothetical protein